MTTPPISRYPVPELKDLPEDLRTRILEVQQKAGFVPNVFLALAHRPAEWRAFMAYHDALLLKDSGSLSKGEREMIIVVTSAANQCLYCVVAHGAILRVYEKKPLIADQLAVNYRKADITPRQRAMLDFAFKITTASHLVDDGDFATLRGHGFSDDDIWDIGAISAFFGLSNRMANLSGMRPNDEFYLMGRLPNRAPKLASARSLPAGGRPPTDRQSRCRGGSWAHASVPAAGRGCGPRWAGGWTSAPSGRWAGC